MSRRLTRTDRRHRLLIAALLVLAILVLQLPQVQSWLDRVLDAGGPGSQPSITGLAPQLDPLVEAGLLVERDGAWVVDGAAVAAVVDRLPRTDRSRVGYDRDEFGPAWADADGNGCDTRNDILARDLASLDIDADGCTVLAGVLDDPYTGTRIDFLRGQGTSAQVQIDHVIPLAAAWTGGADSWTGQERLEFANDPVNLEAVEGRANASKGDRLPGEWMPENRDYHCVYVARIAHLADRYGLAVTDLDADAMAATAADCR